MNVLKLPYLIPLLTTLVFVSRCDASRNSLGYDEFGVSESGGTTTLQNASGGTTAQTQSTGGTTTFTNASGGTMAATTTAVEGEFGAVGVDPTNTTYTRSSGVSPTETTGACHTTSITGTLDGKAVDLLFESGGGGVGGGSSDDWSFFFWFGESGLAALYNKTSATPFPSDLKQGEVRAALEGKLTLPSLIGRMSHVICTTGPSSIERANNHYAVTYTGVVSLPDCESGTPIEGALDLCLGSTCTDENLSGHIDNISYVSRLGFSSKSTRRFNYLTEALEVTGNFIATSATSATLKNTWITDTTTGNIYCASTESSAEANLVKDVDGNTYSQNRYHFRGFRFVGNCRSVSGTDTLVIRDCLKM